MINIHTLNSVDPREMTQKLNIDDLYEKKRQKDAKQFEIFKRMLHRVHVQIRRTAACRGELPCCWFTVPRFIMGVPLYDQAACIAYLLDQLQENKFRVKFYYPDTLFICWNHIVPRYVRDEFKKKTGIEIDEFGEPVPVEDEEEEDDDDGDMDGGRNGNARMQTQSPSGGGGGGGGRRRAGSGSNNAKQFTPIQAYKPSGKMVYRSDLLGTLEERLRAPSK